MCACAHGLKIGPQSRRGAQCAPAALRRGNGIKYPAQMFLGWRQVIQVSPRRGEGTPPYRIFIGLPNVINCSVGNGLSPA